VKLEVIEDVLGIELHEHQREFLEQVPTDNPEYRACLYYRTGAGKTITSLSAIARMGFNEVLVVAPPSTHDTWESVAWHQLGLKIQLMSHAKFRMPSTKVNRQIPIIADEFHMFGGNQAKGWRKLQQVALGLKAPMLLLSATPNYNDAERCYCVSRLLDPTMTKGGYLQFLYDHCITEQDPFSMTPKVIGFREHPDAASFLASLPGVFHLPDEREVAITEVPYLEEVPDEVVQFGFDRRNHRIISSLMEMRHTVRFQGLVDERGKIHPPVLEKLLDLIDCAPRKVLVYCNHSTVAEALGLSLTSEGRKRLVLTGAASTKEKQRLLFEFRRHEGPPILVGTAALATGTDGLDKVCDTLIILDDTDDAALRRQLIGRILPRGDMSAVEGKTVLLFTPI